MSLVLLLLVLDFGTNRFEILVLEFEAGRVGNQIKLSEVLELENELYTL